MATLARSLAAVALLAGGAEGARVSRKRTTEDTAPASKFISGVPVLSYHTAFEGEPVLAEGEREGEWILMMKPGTSDAQIQSLCQAAPKGCKLAGGSTGVPFLELRGTESDLEAVISTNQGAVKYVEPDQMVHLIPEMESDNVESATWGLNRIGADQRGRSGSGATVFVLDTGVRHSHQEFTGRASPGLDMSVGDPKECGGDLSCAADRQGHGTHCAGTAVGDTFGVAPAAAMQSVKVLSDQGSGITSWSLYALSWLASKPTRPAIASMSLGSESTSQIMADAVNGAVNAGVVVVVAAGNSKDDACKFSPAFVPSAITVGATSSTDKASSFSNYGICTNIWAPGSFIVSADHSSDTGRSQFLSGTSMACPHVSGAAALVLDADPSKKPSAVLAELLDGAVRNALDDMWVGDTNALLYVGAGGPPPPPPTLCNMATSTISGSICRCLNGLACYEAGRSGCKMGRFTTSAYYNASCANCECKASG